MLSVPSDLSRGPKWIGNLDENCSAHWAGLLLHAEKMNDSLWWWWVDDEATKTQIASSIDDLFYSGRTARRAANDAARRYFTSRSSET